MEDKDPAHGSSVGSFASEPLASSGPGSTNDGGSDGGMVTTTAGLGGGSGNIFTRVELPGQKMTKRGRPRKYDQDGNLHPSYMLKSPPAAAASGVPPPSHEPSSKKPRGRPFGSRNSQLGSSVGQVFVEMAGTGLAPHILTVEPGFDVASRIPSITEEVPRGICVLSAIGAVSKVTIRLPGSISGTLNYQGSYEILNLTGSYMVTENQGIRSRTGGLTVTLAGPEGEVFGGAVGGLMIAANKIQMVLGTFNPDG